MDRFGGRAPHEISLFAFERYTKAAAFAYNSNCIFDYYGMFLNATFKLLLAPDNFAKIEFRTYSTHKRMVHLNSKVRSDEVDLTVNGRFLYFLFDLKVPSGINRNRPSMYSNAYPLSSKLVL